MASDLALPAARTDDAVLRASLDAIISVDAQGVVLEFNPAAERMFGYVRDDVVGAEMAEVVVAPAQREAHRRGLRRMLDGGEDRILDRRLELDAQRADGSLFAVELAITRMAGSGASAVYTGFIRDLTDSKVGERERHERVERQALVVAFGQTALTGVDPTDLVAHALATLVEGLAVERGVALAVEPDGGLRREAAIGLGPLAGHGEPAGEALAQLLHRTVEADGSLLLRGVELVDVAETGLLFVQGMRSVLCVTLQGDRGSVSGLLAIAAAEPGALRTVDVGFAQAIADVVGTAVARWRADEAVARLGLHDPLTGLANRPLFENRVEQALDRSRRGQAEAGLLLVDLDGFGKLNDAYGHRIGDEVLVGTGVRLDGALPPGATAARLTGDDFGVLVPDVADDGELMDLAHKINLALREPMLAGGRELTTSASIGIVMTERGLGTVGELVRTASAAAIRARERGGGRAELATQGTRRRLVHSPRDAALVEAMIGIGHSLGLRTTAAKVESEQRLRLLRSLGMDRAQGELFAPPQAAAPAVDQLTNGASNGTAAAAVRTLSLGQAAQALGISTTTARRWADGGRLGATRTAGGHRRFAAAEVRRLLAERGRPALAPAEPPRRPLPTLAMLAEEHGTQLAELSWRTLYGDLRAGFFIDEEGLAAAERWLGALASAAETANYEMLHEATRAFMRAAERGGAALLERHLAIERFGETATRALTRRGCPREEIVDVRRLFAALDQRQLADAG